MNRGLFSQHGFKLGRRPLSALRDLINKGRSGPSRGTLPDFSYSPILPNPGPLGPEDRLVFLHIEKTAGSTAHHVLAPHFPEHQVCPVRFGLSLPLWGSMRLAPYRFFSLHASTRMIDPIPGPRKVVTFLREPVARLLSHYNFWRSVRDEVIEQEHLDHIRHVKSLELKVLLSPAQLGNAPDFWNLHTQRLAGDLFVAPSGRPWRDEHELLDTALANLENMSTVGLTEYPDLSFQRIAEDLGIPNRYDGLRLNVTAHNVQEQPDRYEQLDAAMDDETAEALDRATRLDRRVYDRARGLFGDRLRRGLVLKGAVPPHVRTTVEDGCELVLGHHQEGNILFGPYCTLPAGTYRATLWLRSGAANKLRMPGKPQREGSITIDVCSGGSQKIHAVQSVRPLMLSDQWFDPVDVQFTLPDPASLVEIRVSVAGIAHLAVKRGVGLRLL